MSHHGIAPSIRGSWFPQGYVPEAGSRLHHCGKCMNPFLTGDDCACACHEHPTETRGINRSAAVEHPVEGLGRENTLGPQTGAERLEQGNE